jgi:hypothetical protein
VGWGGGVYSSLSSGSSLSNAEEAGGCLCLVSSLISGTQSPYDMFGSLSPLSQCRVL